MTVFICPHFDVNDNIKKNRLENLFSKVSDHRRQDISMFRLTHTRMKLFAGRTGVKEVDEDEVIKKVLRHTVGNHVTIIEGNTGTGKSEMCSLIDIYLREHGKKVLYLGKSSDLVQITTEEIPAYYKECTGKEFSELSGLTEMRDQLNEPEIVAKFGAYGLIMDFNLGPEFKNNNWMEEKFIKYVTRKMVNILFRKTELDIDIFDEDGLKAQDQRSWADLFMKNRLCRWSELASEMNEKFWKTIYSKFSVPDLTTTIHRLQKDTSQERLFIIFEDYGFSRYETTKLLDFLEGDKPENKCEVIIAGTQERIDPSISETASDRFDFFRTQEKETIPFLSEENSVEFIQPFLAYPKMLDSSIHAPNGKSYSTNPKPNSLCDLCQMKDTCKPEMRVLYPFNNVFLAKIYSCLNQKKPREFVQVVWESIYSYAKESIPVSSSAALSDLSKPHFHHLGDLEDGDAKDFMAWYGKNEEGKITAPLSIAIMQGIDFGMLSVVGEEVSYKESVGREEVDDEEKSIPPDLKGYLDHIENWRKDPTNEKWKNTNSYILKGISQTLSMMTDEYAIRNNSPIRIKYGSGDLPVVVQGQTRRANQIIVNPKEIKYDYLIKFLKLGYFSEPGRTKYSIDNVIEQCADQIAEWEEKWRLQTSQYVEEISLKYIEGEVRFRDLSLGSYVMLMFLTDPLLEINPDNIQKWYNDGRLFVINKQILSGFPDITKKIEQLISSQSDIDNWVHDYFGMQVEMLDKNKISKSLNFEKILKGMSTIRPCDIDKIGSRSMDVGGELLTGPVDIQIGSFDAIDLLKSLRMVSKSIVEPKTTDAFDISNSEMDEIIGFIEAYDGVLPTELFRSAQGLLKMDVEKRLDHELIKEIASFSKDKEEYDYIIASVKRIRELTQIKCNLISKVTGWCMYRALTGGSESTRFNNLQKFNSMIEQFNRNSTETNKKIKNFKGIIMLFLDG